MSKTVKKIEDLLKSSIPGVKVEHMADQPGEDVVVFRIETPFFNFSVDQQVSVFAYYREEDDLLQFSDRGLYSFCVEDKSNLSLKRHRNFIRSSGYVLLGSENEDNSFVVNTPTVNISDEDLDLPLLFGHYVSLLLYCGEV